MLGHLGLHYRSGDIVRAHGEGVVNHFEVYEDEVGMW